MVCDTIGNNAKRQLCTLRFLSVGKVAPDIEGEDQDGKPLKLRDYSGISASRLPGV